MLDQFDLKDFQSCFHSYASIKLHSKSKTLQALYLNDELSDTKTLDDAAFCRKYKIKSTTLKKYRETIKAIKKDFGKRLGFKYAVIPEKWPEFIKKLTPTEHKEFSEYILDFKKTGRLWRQHKFNINKKANETFKRRRTKEPEDTPPTSVPSDNKSLREIQALFNGYINTHVIKDPQEIEDKYGTPVDYEIEQIARSLVKGKEGFERVIYDENGEVEVVIDNSVYDTDKQEDIDKIYGLVHEIQDRSPEFGPSYDEEEDFGIRPDTYNVRSYLETREDKLKKKKVCLNRDKLQRDKDGHVRVDRRSEKAIQSDVDFDIDPTSQIHDQKLDELIKQYDKGEITREELQISVLAIDIPTVYQADMDYKNHKIGEETYKKLVLHLKSKKKSKN